MRIIVAIDIIDGKCVRLSKGDFSTRKIYSGNPLEIARMAEDHGINYIHLVDLDGARAKHIVNYSLLEKIASATSLNIDFSGGIRSSDDVRAAFESGAKQVSGGSIPVINRQLFIEWLTRWGAERIILGADCRERKVVTEGWTENSELDIINYLKDYRSLGVEYTICTDIEMDGMLNGPSFDLYRDILKIEGLKLTASGGISSVKDLEELSLAGCEGAVIGKALYEGKIDFKELGKLC